MGPPFQTLYPSLLLLVWVRGLGVTETSPFRSLAPAKGKDSFLSSFFMEMCGWEPLISVSQRQRECVEVDLIKIGISYI